MKQTKSTLLGFVFVLQLSGCFQESKNVYQFKGTKAYALAREVDHENLTKIEKIVKANPQLLSVTSSSGANVLTMSIYTEKFKSFQKLLELGSNPNFTNPYSKESVLIQACKPFGSVSEWRIDNRYAELLLSYGADPNYAVEEEFTDEKGHFHYPTSPLIKASGLNLEMTKLILKNGADPSKKVGYKQLSAFGEAVGSSKYDIINYYIDSVRVDVFQPLYIRGKDSLFIQDYVVNKYTLAKLRAEVSVLERLKKENNEIEKLNIQRWKLIKKLEGLGVDFKNYQFKLAK